MAPSLFFNTIQWKCVKEMSLQQLLQLGGQEKAPGLIDPLGPCKAVHAEHVQGLAGR